MHNHMHDALVQTNGGVRCALRISNKTTCECVYTIHHTLPMCTYSKAQYSVLDRPIVSSTKRTVVQPLTWRTSLTYHLRIECSVRTRMHIMEKWRQFTWRETCRFSSKHCMVVFITAHYPQKVHAPTPCLRFDNKSIPRNAPSLKKNI